MRTKNQDTIRDIERFVREYNDDNGRSPTMQEISKAVGVSTATAHRYVVSMAEDGIIDYCGVRGTSSPKSKAEVSTAPIVGTIACGTPILAEENIEQYVRLPVSLFGRGDFFILKAKGKSMIDVGIDNGDYIVIRQQDTADPGQIVVALLEDEATLKRYYPEPEKRQIRLHPENKKMKDTFVEHCDIQGVAISVIKSLI
mgnify:CR=1 FL=1